VRRLLVVIAAVLCVSVAGAQGWGCFYQDHVAVPDWSPNLWRQHVRLMKRAGMNTLTVSYPNADRLTETIDIAIEEGMLVSSIPVLVLPRCGTAEGRRVLGDQRVGELQADFAERGLTLGGWGSGEAGIAAGIWEYARTQSRFPDQWPEPIGYGPDEPHNSEKWCRRFDCGETLNVWPVTRMWHHAGWRHGTAVMHPHIRCLVPSLDIVVSNLILGADPTLRQQKRECERQGREWWVYAIGCRYAKPEMIRWQMGWLFWQVGARVHLSWCWSDFLEDPTAPEWNERLEGYRLGVEDYRRLESLSDCEQDMRRALWDGEGWPWDEFARAKERDGHTRDAVPDFDFERLMPG
jgi:hypothetical protein